MVLTVKNFFGRTFELGLMQKSHNQTAETVKLKFFAREAVPVLLQRLSVDGRFVPDDHVLPDGSTVYISLSLPGGKGGFGSMLRAIGAQIEKTTNREACRDLSGRRLRDINEEKRLKDWISKQADREKDTQKKRIEKLERLRAKPKHQFHDPDYDKQRSELPEEVANSVQEGLKKDATTLKRKPPAQMGPTKKKTLWLGMEDLESGDSDDSETEVKTEEETPLASDLKPTDASKPEQDSGENKTVRLDLDSFASLEDLLAVGEETLGQALCARGAKGGGSLQQRAERLWALRGKNILKKLHPPDESK